MGTVADLTAVAGLFFRYLTINLCKTRDRKLLLVRTDIENPISAIERTFQHTGDRIRSIAERPRDLSVAIDNKILLVEDIARKIGHNPLIVGAQAGSEAVERADDSDRHLVLMVIVIAEGFAKPFGLVITSAGAGRIDIAEIGFRRGDLIRRGIPINFAGRKKQQAVDFPVPVEVQQPPQPDHIRINRFDWVQPVVDWGSQ